MQKDFARETLPFCPHFYLIIDFRVNQLDKKRRIMINMS